MSLVVQSNSASMTAQVNLSRTHRSLSQSFGKISSGQRITRAADDAAGLGVAENLDATSRSANVAKRNINDGISIIQTYEGAVNELSDINKRLRELAVQSSSETLAQTERAYASEEFFNLQFTQGGIASTLEFNGIQLGMPTGSTTSDKKKVIYGTLDVQAGTNDTGNDRIQMQLASLRGKDMNNTYLQHIVDSGVDPAEVPTDIHMGGLNIDTVEDAQKALFALDFQTDYFNNARSKVGATQNRLESALNNLGTYTQNIGASESRIRDADFAFETAELSKHQIMQQAGTSVLGQANQLPQSALRLI